MAWLAVGCDLFSCHIAFFLLPPFSSLLPLPHINQRSIVEQWHFVNGKNVLSERVAAKPANSERQRSLKVNRSIAASSKPNTSPQSRVFSRKEDQKHNNRFRLMHVTHPLSIQQVTLSHKTEKDYRFIQSNLIRSEFIVVVQRNLSLTKPLSANRSRAIYPDQG